MNEFTTPTTNYKYLWNILGQVIPAQEDNIGAAL